MTPTDQLVEALRQIPSQILGDLVLGLPLMLFVILVLLSAAARHGGRTWR